MLDAKPIDTLFTSAYFEDIAQSTWIFSTSDIYIDNSGKVGSVESLQMKKFCYVKTYECASSRCCGSDVYNWAKNNTYYNQKSKENVGSGCSPTTNTTKYSSCNIVGNNVWYK